MRDRPRGTNGGPTARKFHELNQAYELLLDPLRRLALDAKVRLKEARKARFASYDTKRKGLVEELEARERAFKKARVEKQAEERARWMENERIMEEGRRLREEREKELRKREEEALKAAGEDEPPELGACASLTTCPVTHMHCRGPGHDHPPEVPAIGTPLTHHARESRRTPRALRPRRRNLDQAHPQARAAEETQARHRPGTIQADRRRVRCGLREQACGAGLAGRRGWLGGGQGARAYCVAEEEGTAGR